MDCKKKKLYIYSHQLSLLSSLSSLSFVSRWFWSGDGCLSWVVVWWSWVIVWWSDGHDAIPGSRCDIPGSWVVVVKCFTTYQTKDPILTNNYPFIQAYNLLRFFRVWLNFLRFNFIMELKIYSFWNKWIGISWSIFNVYYYYYLIIW